MELKNNNLKDICCNESVQKRKKIMDFRPASKVLFGFQY